MAEESKIRQSIKTAYGAAGKVEGDLNIFPSYPRYSNQERIESLSNQIDETRANLRLIEELMAQYLEPEQIPLNLIKNCRKQRLIKNRRKQRAKLSELREDHGRLIETVAELKNISEALSVRPYFLNRSEQQYALRPVLKKLKQTPNRPLVCIIHGDDCECHDMFLMCLEKFFLSEFLDSEPPPNGISSYHLRFPEKFRDMKYFQNQLQNSLAMSIPNCQRAESNEEINQILAGHRRPVMLDATIIADDWPKHGSQIIISFLEFWNKWPELFPEQFLIVFLCIKYKSKQYCGFFERFCFQPVNREISKFLERLSSGQGSGEQVMIFALSLLIQTGLYQLVSLLLQNYPGQLSEFKGLVGTVLPKLEGITRTQAEDWARIENKSYFSDSINFHEEIMLEIKVTFEQYKSKKLPKKISMEKLARVLKSFLYDYTTRRQLV